MPPEKFFMLFCCLLIVFSKSTFLKNYFRNTIRVSNRLDPDQAGYLWGLIWIQTVCKSYQQTPQVDKELRVKQSCNHFPLLIGWLKFCRSKPEQQRLKLRQEVLRFPSMVPGSATTMKVDLKNGYLEEVKVGAF